MIDVSIVIPVYNREKTIGHCIECVASQTYANIEIVVVDDGSQDASLDIIHEWEKRDSRVRGFHKKNGGVSSARNTGIKNARGKYIIFVDSDDFINPDYLERMVQTQKEYGDDTLVISNIQQTDMVLYAKRKGAIWILSEKDVLKLFDAWLLESPCNKLFDREYMLREQICFQDGVQLGEDFLFNMDYFMKRTFEQYIILIDNIYNYTVDRTSLSKSYYPDFYISQKKQYEGLYLLAQKKNVEEKEYEIFWRRYYYRMKDALENTNRKENLEPWYVKIHKNTEIIKEPKFQESLNWVEKDMHKLSYIAYRTKSYVCVLVVDFLLTKIVFNLEKFLNNYEGNNDKRNSSGI